MVFAKSFTSFKRFESHRGDSEIALVAFYIRFHRLWILVLLQTNRSFPLGAKDSGFSLPTFPSPATTPKACAKDACLTMFTTFQGLVLGDCTLCSVKIETNLIAPSFKTYKIPASVTPAPSNPAPGTRPATPLTRHCSSAQRTGFSPPPLPTAAMMPKSLGDCTILDVKLETDLPGPIEKVCSASASAPATAAATSVTTALGDSPSATPAATTTSVS